MTFSMETILQPLARDTTKFICGFVTIGFESKNVKFPFSCSDSDQAWDCLYLSCCIENSISQKKPVVNGQRRDTPKFLQ